MIPWMTLMWTLPWVALFAIAAAQILVVRKLRRRLRQLQSQDEALSRRCDELTDRLTHLQSEHRLDHLEDLVAAGVRAGRLEEKVGRDLSEYLDELRAPES